MAETSRLTKQRPKSALVCVPTFEEEARLWAAGYRFVAGVDEAGRGALAGPVVAAAVIAPPCSACQGIWAEVRDSKLLTPVARTGMVEAIQEAALAWGVGIVYAAVIDEIGIAAATRRAMMEAVAALCVPPDHLIIDWVKLPQLPLPQLCVAKADQRIASVAAASILAKVMRDQLLETLGEQYPLYSFHAHKGYGTAHHLAMIEAHGPCAEHRHSFAPIAARPGLWDAEAQP